MNLNGKVAIVTGASAGIGAATVRYLLETGMKVVGFARRKEKILQLSKSDHLFAVSVDLTKEQQILDGFEWVIKNVGPVHVLINNAGVASFTRLIDGDYEQVKKIIDTNLMSVAVTCREAFKNMQQNNIDGYIINVSSVAGRYIINHPGIAMYSASKSALNTLTEHLRLELIGIKSKIRISNVLPGAVKTEILEASGMMTKENSDEFYAHNPWLRSEDVADAIVYLLKTPTHVQITELIMRPVGENM